MHQHDLTGAQWRTSSFSNSGSCVEVARNLPCGVAVRDSKDRPGGVLVLGTAAWDQFLGGIRRGEFS
jgi:Domain of unknown function (DUF397)